MENHITIPAVPVVNTVTSTGIKLLISVSVNGTDIFLLLISLIRYYFKTNNELVFNSLKMLPVLLA
jgi:hypothetical protein